jgi:hypothetical protein
MGQPGLRRPIWKWNRSLPYTAPSPFGLEVIPSPAAEWRDKERGEKAGHASSAILESYKDGYMSCSCLLSSSSPDTKRLPSTENPYTFTMTMPSRSNRTISRASEASMSLSSISSERLTCHSRTNRIDTSSKESLV